MIFDDLPYEVVHIILTHCSQSVVFQVLKSPTYAKDAYALLFENVIIDWPKPANGAIDNYIDSIDPFKGCSSTLVQPLENRATRFTNVRTILSFHRSHPLYTPHTLTCCNEDFAEFEELKPGFLKKFKYLNSLNSYKDTNKTLFDVSSYKHKSFRCPDNFQRECIPRHIETLNIGRSQPKVFLPTVTEAATMLDEYQYQFEYEFFPNLRKLKLCFETHGEFDIPTLESISIITSSADLSKSTNLKEAFIRTDRNGGSVGFSDEYKIWLPPKVERLQLSNLWDYSRVNLDGGDSLTELSLCFDYQSENDLSNLPFPPNLKRLAISMGAFTDFRVDLEKRLVSYNQKFPETLETLTLNYFKLLIKPIIPSTIVALNLLHSSFDGIDFKQLTNLSMVQIDKQGDMAAHILGADGPQKHQLPPQIEYIDYEDTETDNPFIINQFQDLKYAKVKYHNPTLLPEIIIPSSMSTLILESAWLSKVTGGQNLTSLTLNSYKCSKPISLVSLNTLKDVTLCHPQDNNTILYQPIPLLPKSIETLRLESITFSETFRVPENVKFLHISGGSLLKFILNDKLEVFIIDCAKLDFEALFKNIGLHLQIIDIERCGLGKLEADFTSSNLKKISIKFCEYSGKKLKLPNCLQDFALAHDFRSINETPYIDWVDISLCDKLLQFVAGVAFLSDNDKKRVQMFERRLYQKMEKFSKSEPESQLLDPSGESPIEESSHQIDTRPNPSLWDWFR